MDVVAGTGLVVEGTDPAVGFSSGFEDGGAGVVEVGGGVWEGEG